MSVEEFWAAWAAVATTLLTLVALITAVMALRQIGEMARARQAEMLIWIFKELDRLRESRRLVSTQLPSFHRDTFSDMPDELRMAADNVGASFNYLGLMAKEKLVRKRFVVQTCLSPIINCWEALREYVDFRRALRGEHEYWGLFEYLYTEAKEFETREGIRITCYRDNGVGDRSEHPRVPDSA